MYSSRFEKNQLSISYRVTHGNFLGCITLRVVVRAEIITRDFLQTLGNYYLSLTIAKFKVKKKLQLKKFRPFLKALTVKLSIFKNKRTSHPEILINVYRQLAVRLQNDIE